MKANVKVSGNIIVEVEATNQKDLFEELASITEVFGEMECGKCKGQARPSVRQVDDNKFYEMKCTKCGAVLAMGQHKKKETLFPNKYEGSGEDRKMIGERGWRKWTKDGYV